MRKSSSAGLGVQGLWTEPAAADQHPMTEHTVHPDVQCKDTHMPSFYPLRGMKTGMVRDLQAQRCSVPVVK